MPGRFLLKIVVALVLIIAFGAILFRVAIPADLYGFAEREARSRAAFAPLLHLQPLILDNAFGVYHVEFGPDSRLTDSNVAEILCLNQLSAEYDLTLWLKTGAITDLAVPVLSQLTTTDTIVIDGAGLTEAGIAELSSANPAVRLCSADGRRLASDP